MLKKIYSLNKQQEKILGYSKQQVITVLGQECNDLHESVWIYRISELGFFYLKKYMILLFDDKNKVTSVKIKIKL